MNADPPVPRWKTKMLRALNWKFLSAAGAVILVFFAFQSLRGNTRLPAESPVHLLTVAVAKVKRQDLAQEQVFQAEFRPHQEIDLHAKVAGFVQGIMVDIGDRVKAGDVLATLEIPELPEELERAAALERRNEEEMHRADAAHAEAHLAYTRLATINEQKPHLIARQELDAATARDRSTEAALAAAKQEVQVSQAEVKKLRATADYCKITAPFSGVITRRFADQGALIQGGTSPSTQAMPLVRLSQIDRLRLSFPVSVTYVSRIKLGDAVSVRVEGLEKSITGAICRFSRKVDTATRTMEVEVDVPNPDLALIPGVYASVSLQLEHRQNVLTVPAEAVSRQKSASVLVLNKNNELELRPVTLGLETPAKLEIVSGLEENDLVMIGNQSQVKPGQKVEPKLMELGSNQ